MRKMLLFLVVILITSCATLDFNFGFKDKDGNSYKFKTEYNENKHGIEIGGKVKGVDFICFLAYEKKNKGEKLNIETDFSLFEQSGLIKVMVNGQTYECKVEVEKENESETD